MSKNIDNMEVMQRHLSRALSALHDIEYEWEEGTLTEDQENLILEISDQLNDIYYDLEQEINRLYDL